MTSGGPVACREIDVLGWMGSLWGLLGVTWLLAGALVRLSGPVRDLMQATLGGGHWAALLVSVVVMGYAEGYHGFQRRFAPRVVARSLYLRRNATGWRVLLAPLFCMGFFHATPRRRRVAYGLTGMMVVLVLLVRRLVQPWRGIVDAGVLLGLGWGVVSLWVFALRAWWGRPPAVCPETPEVATSADSRAEPAA